MILQRKGINSSCAQLHVLLLAFVHAWSGVTGLCCYRIPRTGTRQVRSSMSMGAGEGSRKKHHDLRLQKIQKEEEEAHVDK